VTRAQLKRWGRLGIMPRAKGEHIPGLRGSASFYDDGEGATTQLLAVCEKHLKRRTSNAMGDDEGATEKAPVAIHRERRKLRETRINLWWDGHAIDLAQIRQDLLTILAPYCQGIRGYLGPDGNASALLDEAERVIPELVEQRRLPIVRAIRHHLPSDSDSRDHDTGEVLRALIMLAFGEQPGNLFDETRPWENAEGATFEQVFRRGLGIDGLAGPLTADDGQRMGAILRSLRTPEQVIIRATDTSLNQARDDARLFTEGLSLLGDMLHVIRTDRVLGLDGLRMFRADTILAKAFVILGALLIGEHTPRSDIESTLRPLAEGLQVFRTVKRLVAVNLPVMKQPEVRAEITKIKRTQLKAVQTVQPVNWVMP
jgi:hypothetical protein